MQSALYLTSPSLPLLKPTKVLTKTPVLVPRLKNAKIHACTAVVNDNSTFDYSSGTSVFPAEACEIVGGQACNVQMYPEVKLKSDSNSSNGSDSTSEPFDREYLEYNSSKTVFLEEACDDLGGEFCEPEFLKE